MNIRLVEKPSTTKHERIWEIPYIPKKQRTSIVNFTKPDRVLYSLITKPDGSQVIVQHSRKKEIARVEVPEGVDGNLLLIALTRKIV